MSDDIDTLEHFCDPRPGDRFHEMYSFWIHVLSVEKDGPIKVEEFKGGQEGKPRVFANWQEWRDAYSYKSMDKPWIRWRDNGSF